jgi:hypothetical protein
MRKQHPLLSFDLISDLYVEEYPNNIDWKSFPTSLIAVVAGDVSSDLDRTIYELKQISTVYKHVLYIDGDLEHQNNFDNIQSNRDYLKNKLSKITNMSYLFEYILIINSTSFLAANLWWGPENSVNNSTLDSNDWLDDMKLYTVHNDDLDYLKYSVKKMQNSKDVSNIVVISHTVPDKQLIFDSNCSKLSSDAQKYVEAEDKNRKISTWVYGHHRPMKTTINDCEFISNPRGSIKNSTGLKYQPLKVIV